MLLAGGASCAGAAAYAYSGDVTAMKFDAATAVAPLLRLLDAEVAHTVGIKAAAAGLFPRETRPDVPALATQLWGRRFSNPFGEPGHTLVLFDSYWETRCLVHSSWQMLCHSMQCSSPHA